MKPFTPSFVSAAVVLSVIVACTGDDPVLGGLGGEGACTAAQKVCDGQCAAKDDPSVGCANEACNPCVPFANGVATCVAGACGSTCAEGFTDCDANPANGCEARTVTDAANCGACGKACGTANTEVATKCEAGACVFTCKAGFGHCGSDPATGCETALTTSKDHCGACGHSCLGGDCVDGACMPFRLASANHPTGVAVDATMVYYTSSSEAYVQRVNRDGTCTPASPCPQEFIGSADPLNTYRGPASIVSDGSFVWFMGEAIAKVGRRAVTGGPITNWGPGHSSGAGNLVVAGGKVYWTSNLATTDPVAHVQRSDLDGTNIETVALYNSPATTFYGVGGITADATHVYWGSINSGVYRKALTDGTSCSEDSTCDEIGGSGAAHVAVDDAFVYWADATTVGRIPKAGGSGGYVASNQGAITSLAAMNGTVYWGVAGAIRKAPQVAATCDGAGCAKAADVTSPTSLVAGPDGLYWTDGASAGGVYRLAK